MDTRPNILFITCHDLGRYLRCYGIPTVQTPALDRLAGNGVLFTNVFATAPQCSPSRASMVTGRYPHCNGVMGVTKGHFGWDLNAEEKHLAEYLHEAGYFTALAGVDGETRHPEEAGFVEMLPGKQPCGDTAAAALHLLELSVGRDEPFYLQVGFFEPHRPFDFGGAGPDPRPGVTVPAYLRNDGAARNEFAQFQGAIAKVDAAIGVLLAELEGLNLSENTLVLFASDHGIPFPRAKYSLYDPGLETACILRWPRRLWSGGKVKNALISNVDYLPTLLEAAGVPVPELAQGRSFAPLLDGAAFAENEEIFAELTYHDYYDPSRCIRTSSHKLIANFSTAPAIMVSRSERENGARALDTLGMRHLHRPDIELYDLDADPHEMTNLADSAEYEGTRTSLAARLHAWMRDTDDPLLRGAIAAAQHDRALKRLEAP